MYDANLILLCHSIGGFLFAVIRLCTVVYAPKHVISHRPALNTRCPWQEHRAMTTNSEAAPKDIDIAAEQLDGKIATRPTFTTKAEKRKYLKDKLASAFRIFGHRGYNENAAGTITIADPINTEAYWVNPTDIHWTLLQPADLLLVDQHGMILPESEPSRHFDKDAFLVHAAIHAARPDVECVAHTHPPYGTAFSHLGKELDPITQDSCAFYKDNAVYNGEMRGVEGGRGAAAALGKRKVLFFKNSGFLTATASIESMVFFFVSCEKSCQVQLLADAAAVGRQLGPPHKIPDEDAYTTWKVVGSELAGFFSSSPDFQALEVRERTRALV